MAIDKTIPNRLQADADQRLVRPEVGEMLDAQNVTMAEGGGSSSGVIKNVRGTLAGTPLTASDRIADDNAVRVIGSVSDPQRGFIYWFVADVSGSSQDAIYQYNTSDDTYRLVLKNSGLNFNSDGFVKANVVNAAFQQDGVTQTALYFTDNTNPPRKINVDRALNSAVYDATGDDFDTVVSMCKPAMQGYPSVKLNTDTSFPENNFRDVLYQFAVQLIYTDGEESAISGYSELTITRPEIFSTMEEAGFGVSPFIDNVCEITLPVDLQLSDLEKIRIVARDGNNGSFFVVDEFQADEDLYRQNFGINKQIYDASSRTYRFYNNYIGRGVSQSTVNKLYDNVPFVASGQSVAGNRVMYSNYQEGRPNTDTNASFTVNYLDDDGTGSGELIRGGGSVIQENTTGFQINIDINPQTDIGVSDILEVGTIMEVSFDFGLDFKIEGDPAVAGEEPIRFSIQDVSSGDSATYYNSYGLDVFFERKTGNSATINAVKIIDTPTAVGNAMTQLSSLFNDATIRYKLHNTTTADNIDLLRLTKIGAPGFRYLKTTGSQQYMDVTWGFDGVYASSGLIEIRPYIKTLSPATAVLSDIDGTPIVGEEIVAGSDNSILRSGIYTGLSGHDLQAQLDYYTDEVGTTDVNISEYLNGQNMSVRTSAFEKTFKAGSSHTFGIVYYDKFNRSGNVNILGSAYVEPIQSQSRSSSQRGACTITVDLSNTTPPEWATHYQIVYAGADSFSNYVQYTTSGGYFKHEAGTTGSSKIPDVHIQEVYLSINTLDVYNEEKNTSRKYSFTEGDKLRVISSFDSSRVYQTSDQGNVMEFDIVGVTTATDEIMGGVTGNSYDDIPTGELDSTVLKLTAPQVNARIDRYQNFDWFDITGTNPANMSSSAASAENLWGQGTVVEIVSPRKYNEERVFYEIGHGGAILNGSHGSNPVLTNGDAYFRPVSCKTSPDEANVGDLAALQYRTFYLESNTVSEGFSSKDWHKGRPHVVFENSATVRRYNGITYSDAYAEDVANLSLSSFNPSLANFFSLDSANGACNYIDTFRDGYLLAFQENRVSRVGVNKDIITTPAAGQIPSLTTSVLGEPVYYLGDFGCGDNPESVLIRDGNAFFVDTSRKKLVRLTSEGLSPVSENGVDSMFKSNLDSFIEEGGTRIVSGYDPEDNQYYVTLRETGAFTGLTLGYNISAGVWQSRYTFYPDMYSDQNGTMYSAYYTQNEAVSDDAEVFHHHTNETDYNTFYGLFNPSLVKVVSNFNPSMVKVFNAISTEGSGAQRWVASSVVTDLGSNGSIDIGDFQEKEGTRYATIRRDSSENSTKHIIPIGRVNGAAVNNPINIVNRVNTLSIPYGAEVKKVNLATGALTDIGQGGATLLFDNFNGVRSINLVGNPTFDVLDTDDELVAVTNQDQNGDPIRGHWAEITLTTNQATPFELYCVNTHIVQSHQDHSLGQQ